MGWKCSGGFMRCCMVEGKGNVVGLRLLVAVALLSLTVTSVKAQDDWQSLLEALAVEEEIDASVMEQLHETMGDMVADPLDVNTATYDDFKSLLILDDKQISDIMFYRDRHGGLKDLRELRMIRSIDHTRCSLLMLVVCIRHGGAKGKVSLGKLLSDGRNELTATVKAPMYERRGDSDGYLGSKYRHSVRYTFKSHNMLKVGLLGSQDSGEPFFKGKNGAGYDFYSGYVELRKAGRWRNIVVGRYRMRMGMGLVMNTYFGFGKNMLLTSMLTGRNMAGGYSSRMESDYLQGGCATYKVSGNVEATAFISSRKIDATLDTTSAVRTILTSGYHRTESEMNRRRNTTLSSAGMNILWHKDGFHAGLTAVAYGTSREIKPDERQLYRRYKLRGDRFFNASLDYGYTHSKLQFSGEAAIDEGGGLATINSLSFNVASDLRLSAIYRFYSYKYNALFARSFSDGGNVNNESGVMASARWTPLRGVQVDAYIDYAYFPWVRYLIDNRSHSLDAMAEVNAERNGWVFSLRYRMRQKQCNGDETAKLRTYYEHRGRMRFGYASDRWFAKAQIDLAHSTKEDSSTGWMAGAQCAVKMTKWLWIYGNASYFNTDDYQSRIYVYERSPRYQFSYSMLYGEGLRYAINAEAKIGKVVAMTLKVGTTNYFDRDHIGDGLQLIEHSATTDVEWQATFKF